MSIPLLNLMAALASVLISFSIASVGVVSVIVILQYRQKTMEKTEEEIRAELKAAVKELQTVSTLVQSMMRSQEVINRSVELAMAGLVTKVERHERDLAKLSGRMDTQEEKNGNDKG